MPARPPSPGRTNPPQEQDRRQPGEPWPRARQRHGPRWAPAELGFDKLGLGSPPPPTPERTDRPREAGLGRAASFTRPSGPPAVVPRDAECGVHSPEPPAVLTCPTAAATRGHPWGLPPHISHLPGRRAPTQGAPKEPGTTEQERSVLSDQLRNGKTRICHFDPQNETALLKEDTVLRGRSGGGRASFTSTPRRRGTAVSVPAHRAAGEGEAGGRAPFVSQEARAPSRHSSRRWSPECPHERFPALTHGTEAAQPRVSELAPLSRCLPPTPPTLPPGQAPASPGSLGTQTGQPGHHGLLPTGRMRPGLPPLQDSGAVREPCHHPLGPHPQLAAPASHSSRAMHASFK